MVATFVEHTLQKKRQKPFIAKITVAEAASMSINVSLKRAITPTILIGIFKGQYAVTDWLSHVELFFLDVPESIKEKFCQQNAITQTEIGSIISQMPTAMRPAQYRAQ